jgi:hypothetical protein
MSPYAAQGEWDAKVKRGDPETSPLFVDISKNGWTRENLMNSAQNWIPGKTVIYDGREPVRVTERLKAIYMKGDF